MQTSQKQQTHTPEPLLHKRKAIFTTIKKTYSVWYITELRESLILFNLRYSFTSLTTLSQEDEFQGVFFLFHAHLSNRFQRHLAFCKKKNSYYVDFFVMNSPVRSFG